MKETSHLDLMAERLESLKSGFISALSFSVVFAIASVFNYFIFKYYFKSQIILSIFTLNWQWLISAGIAAFSGFLFGVTYRYIIREDDNPQLKAGGVLAFGLVRGLTQVDMGLNFSLAVFPLILLGLESILEFAVAAFTLDRAIQFSWIKPFVGNE